MAQTVKKITIHAQALRLPVQASATTRSHAVTAAGGAVPLGISSPDPHLAGLRLRPLRTRNVGKTKSPGGLLHHLRQHPGWHAGIPHRWAATDPAAYRGRSEP